MNTSRRNFIKFGAVAGVFAGVALILPRFSTSAHEALEAADFSGAALGGDPLRSLTAVDFKNYVGTEFTLVNAAKSESGSAVLSNVSVTENPLKSRAVKSALRRRTGTAENFTLSFKLPKGGFSQATYQVRHRNLGLLDLFLVPGATEGGENLLHAVINRI